jgi:hypothetical protein
MAWELVHEDASHLHMEMGHLWYKSYSLHSIGLRGCTIQHGRSDQICLYSETVGSDWSGHAHLHLKVRTRGADANPKVVRSPHLAYVLGGACVAAPGVLVLMGPVRSAPFIQ